MKKCISILLLIAVLLSFCACGKQQGSTDESVDLASPETLYGHIDQTKPVDGVYKIWNAEGVQNIKNHPEGKFELLCNIDMEGAALTPIGSSAQPFTGTLNGMSFVVSNFTLQGGDEADFGFVGVNQGAIRDLILENVTFVPGANAKNVGALVGDNQGEVNRCTLSGTMNVEAAADGASIGSLAGTNAGKLKNSIITVDLLVTAPGSAYVGGIAGTVTGGAVEYVDTQGKLDVTGSNKTVGLLAGNSSNVVYTYCAFIGASNTVDNKLFSDFTGNEDDEMTVAPDSVRRDNSAVPLPDNVVELRDQVVQEMYDLGTIEWHVDKELVHDCKCTQAVCIGVYSPGITYIGIPYKHGNGSMSSFKYCLDENGYMKDWLWDMDTRNGYDSYIGSMCNSATAMAWWKVSNTSDYLGSEMTLPFYYPNYGCIPVGEGWWENVAYDSLAHLTKQYTDNCTEQEFYEVLAMTYHGDLMTNAVQAGYHTVMIASDPVVVRDQNGNIDGNKSYLLTHEQTSARYDETTKIWTSWRINEKNTFFTIRDDGYLPFRCEELITGEMETAECKMLDNPGGQLGMTCGVVKGNYYLESVTLTITDSQGNVILDKINFPKAGKFDDGNTRATSLCYIDSYDMAYFTAPLQSIQFEKGETYSYKVSAHQTPGYDFVVFEDSFTYGAA